MNERTLRVGTRGSELALLQTRLVTQALQQRHPDLQIKVVTIQTQGDKDFSPIPTSVVGKAWFTAEIERALRDGTIDLAVHSLKDVPMETSEEFRFVTVLERDDPRDALISKSGAALLELPAEAVIGTDSSRRRCQLLDLRPDVVVKSIRGNVNTRMKKLAEQDYAALVLAAAGLKRMGWADRVTEYFDPTQFVPAAGQGALAAEVRVDDGELIEWMVELEDKQTVVTCQAERVYATAVGGGCKQPVGSFAEVDGQQIRLYGMIGSVDRPEVVRRMKQGEVKNIEVVARQLAEELMTEGAEVL